MKLPPNALVVSPARRAFVVLKSMLNERFGVARA
jgi:hypothetical protein